MMTRLRSVNPRHVLALVWTFVVPSVWAQTAPATGSAASTSAADKKEEVVQLSPFQVPADAERGYQALNTLSGTRLNSKLEDLGSSISVVTMQQMLDTAVTDLNDVFLYE